MNEINYELICSKIKEVRKNKKATQEQVADFLGITKQAYYRYEKGVRKMSLETIIKITKYFNLPEGYFLAGSKLSNKIKDDSIQKLIDIYINLYDELIIKKELIYKTKELNYKERLSKEYKVMYNEFISIEKNITKWLENKNFNVLDLEIIGGHDE